MSIVYTRVMPDGRTAVFYESGTVNDIRAQLENSPEMRRIRETEKVLARRKALFEAIKQYKECCEITNRAPSETDFKTWCVVNGLDAQYLCGVPGASELIASVLSSSSSTPSDLE